MTRILRKRSITFDRFHVIILMIGKSCLSDEKDSQRMESFMKNANRIFQSLTLILQFGLNMIVPILMCTLFGVWIGRRYDIMWITIPLFLVGALAGFTSVFRMARKIIEQDSSRDRKHVKKNK